jgi:hypothetical protein
MSRKRKPRSGSRKRRGFSVIGPTRWSNAPNGKPVPCLGETVVRMGSQLAFPRPESGNLVDAADVDAIPLPAMGGNDPPPLTA